MILLTIGQVAKRAGVTHDTIRLYERYGLIEKPERAPNGYRQYTEEVINRLRFINRAKVMGFTLKEIAELLEIRRTSQNTCDDMHEQATLKLTDVDQKLSELQQLRQALKKVIDTCEQQKPGSPCPLLNLLEQC